MKYRKFIIILILVLCLNFLSVNSAYKVVELEDYTGDPDERIINHDPGDDEPPYLENDVAYHKNDPPYYSIINFVIDVIAAIICIIFIGMFLSELWGDWSFKHSIALLFFLLLFYLAGNYKLALVPIYFILWFVKAMMK